nr:hypothetical protein [Otarine picobirnavirus]AMP18956.1 hypothetical protein [Otarine picobirnavirus]
MNLHVYTTSGRYRSYHNCGYRRYYSDLHAVNLNNLNLRKEAILCLKIK